MSVEEILSFEACIADVAGVIGGGGVVLLVSIKRLGSLVRPAAFEAHMRRRLVQHVVCVNAARSDVV